MSLFVKLCKAKSRQAEARPTYSTQSPLRTQERMMNFSELSLAGTSLGR